MYICIKVINKIKITLCDLIRNFYFKYRLKRDFKKAKNNIYIFCSPIHGNIGDHAILLAEKKFLNNYFEDVNIIEIESNFFMNNINYVKRYVGKSLIFITGGGFLGDLWLNEEIVLRTVLEIFPNNDVIVFPQTIFFTNTNEDNEELNISKKIYEKHKNLTFFCREKYSYEFMKKTFENVNVKLCPDMALYLSKENEQSVKKNVLLCMRKDKEKKINENDFLYDVLGKKGYLIVDETDTVVKKNIYAKDRDKMVNSKIKEFAKYELVITDRLHGMIFSFLANTPCIVFENRSYKVRGVYQWLKNIPYIKLSNIENFEEDLSNIKEKKDYNFVFDKSQYDELFYCIEKNINKN